MVSTVAAAFEIFDTRIQPTSDDRLRANMRAADVCAALKPGNLVEECFQVGSMVRSTAIAGSSDVDILVSLRMPPEKFASPRHLIDSVGLMLEKHYSQVSKGSIALSVTFAVPPSVDVIPAIRNRTGPSGDHLSYWIGSLDNDSWQEFVPARHDSLVLGKEAELGPRFKSLVRMVKVWNRRHGRLFSSSGIEELVSRTFQTSMPGYPEALCEFFGSALGFIKDDSRHSATQMAKLEALSRGLEASVEARSLAEHGKSKMVKVMDIWRGLFGDEFPTYVS